MTVQYVVSLAYLLCAAGNDWNRETRINVATKDLCEGFRPPDGKLVPNDGRFTLISTWLNDEDAVIYVNGNENHTLKGVMMQGRINNTPVGNFEAGEGETVLDCPPGRQNTLTGIYDETRDGVAGIWQPPNNFTENNTHVTFSVVVLTANREFCLFKSKLDIKQRELFVKTTGDKQRPETSVNSSISESISSDVDLPHPRIPILN